MENRKMIRYGLNENADADQLLWRAAKEGDAKGCRDALEDGADIEAISA